MRNVVVVVVVVVSISLHRIMSCRRSEDDVPQRQKKMRTSMAASRSDGHKTESIIQYYPYLSKKMNVGEDRFSRMYCDAMFIHTYSEYKSGSVRGYGTRRTVKTMPRNKMNFFFAVARQRPTPNFHRSFTFHLPFQ